MYDFPVPTSDLRVLANAVNEVLPQLFSKGVRFYKAGIGAIELVPEQFMQADLFTPTLNNTKLMNSLDSINKVFGKGTIRLASEQQTKSWEMKRDFLSPRYTTRWSDIPKIQC